MPNQVMESDRLEKQSCGFEAANRTFMMSERRFHLTPSSVRSWVCRWHKQEVESCEYIYEVPLWPLFDPFPRYFKEYEVRRLFDVAYKVFDVLSGSSSLATTTTTTVVTATMNENDGSTSVSYIDRCGWASKWGTVGCTVPCT